MSIPKIDALPLGYTPLMNASGLEPETCGLKGHRSTIELRVLLLFKGIEPFLPP